jgi:capsular polysaccharide transport system permease protein
VSAELINGFRVQKRVVWALMLRETKTLFGKHKLGYLWAVINASFQIGVFWAIREFAGFQSPHGMSTPVFLLCGFVPWFIFNHGLSNGMSAIWANRSLLTYPQVFPLDPLVARVALQCAMQAVVFILLLFVALVTGHQVTLVDPLALFVTFVLATMLAFGGATLCSGLNLMWPTTSQLVPMLIRALFFTSGLFFSVSDLPEKARNFLFYNPLTHLLEYARSAFVDGYGAHYIDLPYAFGFALVFLVVGLLIERYARRYLDRMV